MSALLKFLKREEIDKAPVLIVKLVRNEMVFNRIIRIRDYAEDLIGAEGFHGGGR